MPKVVISEFMDEAAIAAELAGFDVLYDPGLVDRPDDLAAAVAEADALIVRNRTQVRGALLAAARDLKVVGRLGVGLDNIDVAACRARGIAVYPATGANDVAVAEYVIATAMLLLRGAYGATAARRGRRVAAQRPDGPRDLRQAPRPRRLRRHRPRDRPAGRGARHGGRRPRPASSPRRSGLEPGLRSRAAAGARRSDRPERRALAARAAHRRDARPDRRGGAGPDAQGTRS